MAALWLSTFLLNALVSRVKRRMCGGMPKSDRVQGVSSGPYTQRECPLKGLGRGINSGRISSTTARISSHLQQRHTKLGPMPFSVDRLRRMRQNAPEVTVPSYATMLLREKWGSCVQTAT
jgi:hypothetical protein